MKKYLLLISLWILPFLGGAQQTIDGTIMHGGLVREYILYVPASYHPDAAAPLVLNFHGYTSNNFEQMFYGDFRPIADTAGFIVVHPLGTVDLLGNPHWNVGWGTSTVDDVAFTAALIDTLSAAYNINQERVYSTGMSNGGFMSYQLACRLSNRIAAIASVTGTMTIGTPGTCSPAHPTPIMEIHGTADATVPYNGNILFESIPSVLSYWAAFNHCDATPIITDVDDIDPNDGSTVEHHLFDNGDNGIVMEHYKVINGAHTWPGTAFGGGGTNQDINASKEIWRFFSTYDIHGKINTTSDSPPFVAGQIKVFPNPTHALLTVDLQEEIADAYLIYNLYGHLVKSGLLPTSRKQIDVSDLPTGMYILTVNDAIVRFFKAE